MSNHFASISWFIVIVVALSTLGCLKPGSSKKSTAILRVNREAYRGSSSDFMIYKETQASLLKSNFVMNSALRGLSGQQFKNVDPVALASELNVTVGDENELIMVTLRQGVFNRSPGETKQILDAVINAYEKEIVNKERIEQVQTLTKLRKRYGILFDTIKKKSDEIGQLANVLGSTEDPNSQQSVRKELAIQSLALLREKRIELQLKQVAEQFEAKQDPDAKPEIEAESKPGSEAESEAESEPESEATRDEEPLKSDDELVMDVDKPDHSAAFGPVPESSVAAATKTGQQIEFLERQIAAETVELARFGTMSGDLQARMDDLAALRKDLQTVRKQMQVLEIGLDGPKAVTVIQAPSLPE